MQDSAAVLAAANKAAAGGLLGPVSKPAAVQLAAAEDVQPLRVGLDDRETPAEPAAPFEEPVLCHEVLRLLLAVVAAHSKVGRLATGWAAGCEASTGASKAMLAPTALRCAVGVPSFPLTRQTWVDSHLLTLQRAAM